MEPEDLVFHHQSDCPDLTGLQEYYLHFSENYFLVKKREFVLPRATFSSVGACFPEMIMFSCDGPLLCKGYLYANILANGIETLNNRGLLFNVN